MITLAEVKVLAKKAYPDYKGRKFYCRAVSNIVFHDTNWGGGTRVYYTAVNLTTGETVKGREFAPWSNPIEGETGQIPEGFGVITRSIFLGKESGVTLYYNLPQTKEITNG